MDTPAHAHIRHTHIMSAIVDVMIEPLLGRLPNGKMTLKSSNDMADVYHYTVRAEGDENLDLLLDDLRVGHAENYTFEYDGLEYLIGDGDDNWAVIIANKTAYIWVRHFKH